MKRLVFAIALLLPTGIANACSIVVLSDFRDSLRDAKSVFVFHVTSLEVYKAAENDWPSFRGSIEVVETLHGPKPGFTAVNVDGVCNDTRLDVDGYYVSATSDDGRTLQIEAGDTSLINISDELYFGTEMMEPSFSLKALRDYFRGVPLPEQFPSAESVQSVQGR
jgi:hypothetical protein